jgi:hypothetical protein
MQMMGRPSGALVYFLTLLAADGRPVGALWRKSASVATGCHSLGEKGYRIGLVNYKVDTRLVMAVHCQAIEHQLNKL